VSFALLLGSLISDVVVQSDEILGQLIFLVASLLVFLAKRLDLLAVPSKCSSDTWIPTRSLTGRAITELGTMVLMSLRVVLKEEEKKTTTNQRRQQSAQTPGITTTHSVIVRDATFLPIVLLPKLEDSQPPFTEVLKLQQHKSLRLYGDVRLGARLAVILWFLVHSHVVSTNVKLPLFVHSGCHQPLVGVPRKEFQAFFPFRAFRWDIIRSIHSILGWDCSKFLVSFWKRTVVVR